LHSLPWRAAAAASAPKTVFGVPQVADVKKINEQGIPQVVTACIEFLRAHGKRARLQPAPTAPDNLNHCSCVATPPQAWMQKAFFVGLPTRSR
jgi:hypothetical protein